MTKKSALKSQVYVNNFQSIFVKNLGTKEVYCRASKMSRSRSAAAKKSISLALGQIFHFTSYHIIADMLLFRSILFLTGIQVNFSLPNCFGTWHKNDPKLKTYVPSTGRPWKIERVQQLHGNGLFGPIIGPRTRPLALFDSWSVKLDSGWRSLLLKSSR